MEPLAGVVTLLAPRAVGAKIISGAGRWAVRYDRVESAGFGLVLSGACRLAVDGAAPIALACGDFVLLPATPGFTMASDPDAVPVTIDPDASAGLAHLHHGDADAAPDFRMLGGFFRCEPANVALLADLLPALLHVRAADPAAGRLAALIDLVADEVAAARPGRDLMVAHAVEMMLIEALRLAADGVGALARPGLLAGLADPQLARALRRLHADVARPWTVAALAREAGLSRSVFSRRFGETVGMAPVTYLIGWRMALARDMLQRRAMPLEAVAEAIGYQSASAFSTAFRREVGCAPGRFTQAPARA